MASHLRLVTDAVDTSSGSTPFVDTYQAAGLVNARFGIDGREPLFWGYYDPSDSWNGWAVPAFRREVVSLIAGWINDGDNELLRLDGDVLYVDDYDTNDISRIESDHLGLYRFDGWAWRKSSDSTV